MLKKCLLILLDGLGDRSHEELGGLTPLQSADTPHLDKISQGGSNGLFHSLAMGSALSSEIAHLLMFGYDLQDFCGRGALEAIGYGVNISDGDVALMAKISSVKEDGQSLRLVNPTPVLKENEVKELTSSVQSFNEGDIEVSFNRTKGSIGVVTMKGNVSPLLTDTDPFIRGALIPEVAGWQGFDKQKDVEDSANALTSYLQWSYQMLSSHEINIKRIDQGLEPANFILTQRAGALKKVQKFHDKWGLKGCIIGSGAVYKGLGEYIGLDFHMVKDSDNPGKDIGERLKIAEKLFDEYDFIHLHTKAPDEAAHKKDPIHKKKVIESLDNGIGNNLFQRDDLLTVVTADHSTPSSGKLLHSGEPVPVTFSGKGVRVDSVSQFNETSCAPGCLGLIRGKEFMLMIQNYLDRARLGGTADSPGMPVYWPGSYKLFKIKKD